MKLIRDSGPGGIAHVEIDGVEWFMGSEEYNIMKNRRFFYWPYELKKINPMPHSCQRCKNRPVDFRTSNQRMFMPTVLPCRMHEWTRSAPFFDNPDCLEGDWE